MKPYVTLFLVSLASLMIWGGTPRWSLQDTELFGGLLAEQVVYFPGKGFFVMDADNNAVLQFNMAGEKVGVIGGRGQGPGEVMRLMGIAASGDRLVLRDFRKLEVFDSAGTWQQTLTTSGPVSHHKPVGDGWAYLRNTLVLEEDNPLQLYLAGQDLTAPRLIKDVGTQFARSGKVIQSPMLSMGKPFKYNPARSTSQLVTSSDRQFFMFHPAHTSELYIYDGHGRLQGSPITLEGKRLPFSEDYGNRQLARMRESLANRPRPVEVEADFPEFFPMIYRIESLWDNCFRVVKYGPMPDVTGGRSASALAGLADFRRDHSLFFGTNGRSRPQRPHYYYSERIVAETDDGFYVTAWLPEQGELSVVLVDRDQVLTYLEATTAFEPE